MPVRRDPTDLTPPERRRELAAILARGVIRWRRCAKAVGIIDAQESSRIAGNGLELLGETRLSVSDDTRVFTPRDDGDDA